MQIKELGHIVFYVTNLQQSVHFYRDILGFRLVAQKHPMAAFSSGRTHHELLLIEIGGKKKQKKLESGFYHVGLKIGNSSEDIKKAYNELKQKGVFITGAVDHGVTHSLYIEDPDGNEIELYADVSDAWKKNPKAIIGEIKGLKLD